MNKTAINQPYKDIRLLEAEQTDIHEWMKITNEQKNEKDCCAKEREKKEVTNKK